MPTLGLEDWCDLSGTFWSQILAICGLPGRQVKAPSGTIGKRPSWSQILAGSLLEPDFGNLRASRRQVNAPSGTIGKRPFWSGARFWQFAGFPAASKRAFWDYWETAVLGQILAGSPLEPDFGNLAGSLWDLLESLRQTPGKPPCRCVKRAAAREHQGTSVFQGKIFPVGRVEPDAVFGHFEALFCLSEAWNVVFAA